MAAARAPKKLDQEGLWNFALRVLGERAYSAAELKQKLVRRAQLSSDVTSVMARLREYGLINDEKFSETFANARRANEGFGRFRVLRDLRAKQVPGTIAEKAVGEAFAGIDEKDLAEAYLLRKYRGKDLPVFLQEQKNLSSAYRRLRTAGFSSGVTLGLLRRYSRRVEEWEEVEEDRPAEESI